ncbi:MAG: ABC transporter substrate-binding protein, partial [Myxococcota bacterium]|nr:ABC transporter substrate-binding protein [Myxococcota bacterium]
MRARGRSAGDAESTSPAVSSGPELGPIVRLASAAVIIAACARGVSGPTPLPTLASSPVAATAFDEIREEWGDPNRSHHDGLRKLLERFLARFPNDGLVPMAGICLALVAMEQGDIAVADRQLAASEGLRPGSAHDLWMVARARRLRLGGDPEAALEILRPLVGKNVDPMARAVIEEELTLAALATHRDYEAISYMDAWLRASSEEDKSQTVEAVNAIVERLPKGVLVGALRAMRTQRARFGYGVDIERILAGRLAKIAMENSDPELARLLLDPDAGAMAYASEAGAELSELAASRRGLNSVDGRTIGLLLPTESPALRDESADVLRGVMWALGLPRGLRTGGDLTGAAEAGASSSRPTCVPFEPAPPLAEPRPGERLRLVTRDDAGSAARTEVSLDELAGEGAAVVIAGLDAQTAARALDWGEGHGVPVVLLVPPMGRGTGAFGFILGESRQRVVAALADAIPSLTREPVATVIDQSEVPLFPQQGGRVGPLNFRGPVSCDTPATNAGDPRFPIAEWDHDKVRAWLVSGSPRCALDIVSELSTAHSRGTAALTLEAAALPAHFPGLRVVTASAGVVPGGATSDIGGDELERFSATLGDVSWWTALGRDAATLARVAVDRLPTDMAVSPRAVADRRNAARDMLASARARLWTSEATSWTPAHTMKRTVCA